MKTTEMTSTQITRYAATIAEFWENVAEERGLTNIVGCLEIAKDETGALAAVPEARNCAVKFEVTPRDHESTVEAVEFAIMIALDKLNAKHAKQKPAPEHRTRITKIDRRQAGPNTQAARMLGVELGEPFLPVTTTYHASRCHVASWYTDKGVLVVSQNSKTFDAAIITEKQARDAEHSVYDEMVGFNGLADAACVTRCLNL